jgi:PTH1 family peptidyl-tRNA hydrolase
VVTSADPWLVVGLGNPGPRYAGTRHNVGAMVVDALARRNGVAFGAHKGKADVAAIRVAGQRVLLAKPRSFMNVSGAPVLGVRDYYKVPTAQLIVVHDELDVPFGAVRLKSGGGDNGHNGLRSVTGVLGRDYLRVRVGIGRPPGRQDPADFVLKDFSTPERKDLDLVVETAADAVVDLVEHGLAAAQNRFHALPPI